METGLKGRYALVTGGSRGIGQAIALALADEGCNVAICSRDALKLRSNIGGILAKGRGSYLALRCDVLNPQDIDDVLDRVANWGRLQVLVNNVGGGGRWGSDFCNTEDKTWEEVNDKNLMAAVRFTRLALPKMAKQGWGKVVTISSIYGREAGGRPWFATTKAAEIAFMKSMASDPAWLERGITFNTVVPGVVAVPDTPWQDTGVSGLQVVRPEEVAAAVVFLCSQQASGITGACLVVDRGQGRAF